MKKHQFTFASLLLVLLLTSLSAAPNDSPGGKAEVAPPPPQVQAAEPAKPVIAWDATTKEAQV